MEELESLRAQVTSLSLRNDKLEEECDLLASANHRLTAELTTLRSMTPSNATSKVQCEKDKEDAVVFTEGAGDYARTQVCFIPLSGCFLFYFKPISGCFQLYLIPISTANISVNL